MGVTQINLANKRNVAHNARRIDGDMKSISRKFQLAVLTLGMACAVTGFADDGVPEVNREVRAKEATKKLNDREQVALIYVKGMT